MCYYNSIPCRLNSTANEVALSVYACIVLRQHKGVVTYDSTKGWLPLKLCLRRIVITNTKTDPITFTSFLLPYIHAQATKPLNRIRKEKKSDQFHPCLVPNKLNGLRPTTSACHLSRVLTLRALFKCFYPNPLQAVLQCH